MRSFFSFQNILIFFLFPFGAVFLIPYFQYEVTPDGVSYLSIAQKYMSGNFSEAINGFWSPVISWTLVPLLILKISPIIAFKIHSIIAIVLCCYSLKRLGESFHLKKPYINFLIICGYFILLPYGFIIAIADLVLVFVLINYFIFIFSDNYIPKNNYGFFCGLLGGAAFLSKAYAFYFFLIHFTVINIFFYLSHQNKRRLIRLNFISGLSVFLLISSIWISALTLKYKSFTISTTGKYNFHISSPGMTGEQVMEYAGFFAPPNATAISVWEDPGLFHLSTWNPLSSKEDFIHFLKNIYHNLLTLDYYLIELSTLTFAILVFLFFLILKENSFNAIIKSKATWLLLTILIYSAGYCLIQMERRYFLPSFILIMIAGAMLMQQITFSFSVSKRNVLLIFIALFFLYHPVTYIKWHLNRGMDEAMIGYELKEKYKINGNVASDSRWYKSLSVTYHMGCRYFGIPEKEITKEKLERDLQKLEVDYYIDWKESGPDFTPDKFKEITNGGNSHCKIYKIK